VEGVGSIFLSFLSFVGCVLREWGGLFGRLVGGLVVMASLF
jgi:hypothetical protein